MAFIPLTIKRPRRTLPPPLPPPEMTKRRRIEEAIEKEMFNMENPDLAPTPPGSPVAPTHGGLSATHDAYVGPYVGTTEDKIDPVGRTSGPIFTTRIGKGSFIDREKRKYNWTRSCGFRKA